MQPKTVWQLGIANPDNAANLATIQQWWAGLNAKEVSWKQRLINPDQDAIDLNWDTQRFDEKLLMHYPEIRGITLYWKKSESSEERSTTPQKLELDSLGQQLFIFPKSQNGVVIRVALPVVKYQSVEMQNPQIDCTTVNENAVLTLKDDTQKLTVKVMLSPDRLSQLKQQLS